MAVVRAFWRVEEIEKLEWKRGEGRLKEMRFRFAVSGRWG